MTKKKDLEIVVPDEIKKKMEEDPELKKAMQSFFEAVHQASAAVESGGYDSFDDAIEGITGSRPMVVDFGEEE